MILYSFFIIADFDNFFLVLGNVRFGYWIVKKCFFFPPLKQNLTKYSLLCNERLMMPIKTRVMRVCHKNFFLTTYTFGCFINVNKIIMWH